MSRGRHCAGISTTRKLQRSRGVGAILAKRRSSSAGFRDIGHGGRGRGDTPLVAVFGVSSLPYPQTTVYIYGQAAPSIFTRSSSTPGEQSIKFGLSWRMSRRNGTLITHPARATPCRVSTYQSRFVPPPRLLHHLFPHRDRRTVSDAQPLTCLSWSRQHV